MHVSLDNAMVMHAGSIHTVYDLLLRYNLHIVGEKFYNVNHCLMVVPGVKQKDITRVLSHQQALAQCQDYIRALGGEKEAVDDTAGMSLML
jgi:arogenate/prephenate dehydratase